MKGTYFSRKEDWKRREWNGRKWNEKIRNEREWNGGKEVKQSRVKGFNNIYGKYINTTCIILGSTYWRAA